MAKKKNSRGVSLQTVITALAKTDRRLRYKKAKEVCKLLCADSYIGDFSGYKFDFSFQLKRAAAVPLRFTFNNRGETEQFWEKIFSVAEFFDDPTTAHAVNTLQVHFQTRPITLGIEWFPDDARPSFKVETEFTALDSFSSIKKIAALCDIPFSTLEYAPGMRPMLCAGAIKIANGTTSLKAYFKPDKQGQMPEVYPLSPAFLREAAVFFKELIGGKAFYLLGVRYASGAPVPKSAKLYGVYETREFSCAEGLAQRRRFLKRIPLPVSVRSKLKEIEDICARRQCIVYPTAFGVEVKKEFNPQGATIYFSVIPQASG